MGRGPRRAWVAALLLLTACSSGTPDPSAGPHASDATTSPAVVTLSPLPALPTPPATGRLVADMRQSSRDAALGRMEVWILNDRLRDATPTRIVYRDDRLRGPLPGERLRLIPARSERGFPLSLPARPRCSSRAPAGSGTVTVTAGALVRTLPVEDETDVVGRYWSSRCLELAVAAVARLWWSDRVPVSDPGEGSVGALVLRWTPRPGATRVLHVDEVVGTPLLTSQDGSSWLPRVTIRGSDRPGRVALPVIPSRCDDHVFMESGGATAFRVKVRLTGGGDPPQRGDLILRMAPAGASAAIGFARDSCGLG